MNDFELESKLRGVPVPERSEEYWNDFPAHIRVQLKRQQPVLAPRRSWRPGIRLATGFALAVGLIIICIQFQPLQAASAAINKHEKKFHQQIAKLDAGLHKLMFNPHGMGYLLAEAN